MLSKSFGMLTDMDDHEEQEKKKIGENGKFGNSKV